MEGQISTRDFNSPVVQSQICIVGSPPAESSVLGCDSGMWIADTNLCSVAYDFHNSPVATEEIPVNDICLWEPADADMLVAIGGDDVLSVRSENMLRDDGYVTEEEVGVGV